MTFQAYLDTIMAKTGLGPDDFRRLAGEKGLLDGTGFLAEGTKPGTVIAWLKEDFGLGQGHGMAIVSTLSQRPVASDRIEKQFAGGKARWRSSYEALLTTLEADGPVGIAPTATYISLLRGSNKFAIVAFTTERMDVGIKLKDAPVTDRFEASGPWNVMVTHRARITDAAQVDAELLGWLRRAYQAA